MADTMSLKIEELLKEVQLDYSSTTTQTINDTVSSIKRRVNSIPQDIQVTADLAPKFIKDIGADKVDFQFKRPKSIEVGGSYSIQCVLKPDVNVDLFLRLPKECFHEKDFLNHRYHGKRCLYLCIIKKNLESFSLIEKVEWSFFQNESRKPILVVYPVVKLAGLPGFSIRLIPTADSLFNVQNLSIEYNNLQSSSQATPVYNNSILEDMFMEHGAKFVKKSFIGWKALGDALILLKVWARQRSSLHTYDSLNGYLISIIMAYLASESSKSHINKAMTIIQIVCITLDFMATSKLRDSGIFFKPEGGNDMSKEERKRYADYFPAVICDLSAHFNLVYRMTKGGLMELQDEAALALRCIDECKEGGFVELFMTKIDFRSKFDYCIRLNLKGTEVSAEGFCLDNECWRLYENKVHSLLQEGLGDRVKFVRVTWRNTTSTSNISDGLSKFDKELLTVGISVSLPEAFDEYTRGPFLVNKQETLKFVKFWGDKVDLLEFENGTRNVVIWECETAKRHCIIKWVTEYVLERHLSLNHLDSFAWECIFRTPINNYDTDILEPFQEPVVEFNREQSTKTEDKREENRTIADFLKPSMEVVGPSIIPPKVEAESFDLTNIVQLVMQMVQFHGYPDEDPYDHIANFLEICDLMQIKNASSDAIRLRVFPLSLKDKAKSWLRSLPAGSITTWNTLTEKFLMHYSTMAKTVERHKDILTYQQMDGESLYDTWERFKEMLRKCPNHGLDNWLQIQTFYGGLSVETRQLIDGAAGGILMKKTPKEAYDLIDVMSSNIYQWRFSASSVNRVDAMAALTTQMADLNQRLDTLQRLIHARHTSCELCGESHLSRNCQEGNYTNYDQGGRFDYPFGNNYDPNWSYHHHQQHQSYQPEQETRSSWEDLMAKFVAASESIQTTLNNQEASIHNLESQIGQIAKHI